ncbi:MAG: hypothetical protein F4187_06155 [Gemmatimonadetes bacterium]|nr:hypothetical protein [Gemmatimonadota bacterium]MYI06757.1 hypothetical protein [Gemmatimonadota bacterium]
MFSLLCVLALALPLGVAAQESEPETVQGAEPDTVLEVAWREPHRAAVVGILKGYYTGLIHRDLTTACRADRGELCMNGDHEDQRWTSSTPREPEQIAGFVERMTEAALDEPGDALGFAQAVYAVARLGSLEEALALAEQCTSVDWWCELVLGMVQQRAGRPERAERHFRTALPEADSALACQLTGIDELLAGADQRAYRGMSCAGRAGFERRFWWLADPMLSMPGNDRWAEHVNRRFELILHERLLWALGNTHPVSHEEAVVRRGHEDSWNKPAVAPPPGPSGLRRWTSLAAARYRFTPVSGLGGGMEELRYELDAGPNDEGYTPPGYGPVFEAPAQFARFRKGGSLFVAAAAELDDLPLRFASTLFVLSPGPERSPTILDRSERTGRPTFSTVMDPATAVVGIETVARDGTTARARSGLVPLAAGGLALSDALLLAPSGDDLPGDLDEAVESMLGRTTIKPGEELAVYWEIYGLSFGQPVEITLQLQKDGEGLLTRVLRTLRVRAAAPATEVSWTEAVIGGTHPMAVTIDVTGQEEGDYELKIGVTGPDGSNATTIRRVQLAVASPGAPQ